MWVDAVNSELFHPFGMISWGRNRFSFNYTGQTPNR